MSKKTPLYESHIKLKADMTDFGGFQMPIRYTTSIVEEHLAVRNKIGMFDTSHMGRYWIIGDDAKNYLDYLVPRNIQKLSDGTAGYSFMLNERGGFRDDVIISQFSENEFMVVCNAGNRQKIWEWMVKYAEIWKNDGKNVLLEDRSDFSCMIAVQGPKAMNLLNDLTGDTLPEKRFRVKWSQLAGEKILFSTTGYTGEAGGEVMLFATPETINEKAVMLWDLFLSKGVVPCALGSRDTLRLEAGYRLYGNDIDENIHLLESGLDFYPFADINKESGYVGQDAVIAKQGKIEKVFVGFKLLTRGIARHGYKVLINDNEGGVVLSGTQSPLTKEPFGMALVTPTHKEVGSRFEIDLRGKTKPAEVINLPIYDENIYGMRRT
ncbi:MAG: glycine cleavage system aminomethyltransferase GcvT [Candidatus Kariarchaeaceae archaeon]|jgi:aminomethyltransferase